MKLSHILHKRAPLGAAKPAIQIWPYSINPTTSTLITLFSHHDDGGEQRRARAHHDKAVNETRAPNDSIVDPHGFESLLEAQLLLQHNTLHSHGHSVDPGQHHKQGEAAVQCDHEAGGEEGSEEGEEEEGE